MFLSKCIIYIIVDFLKMKKEQMLYIGLGLLVVFVFMLVTMNTSSVSRHPYHGYTFDNALAKTAADPNSNSAMPIRPSHHKKQEGFLTGTSLNSDVPNWRLEDYLDDSRGVQCADKSFGITASGGPLCLTPEQARAMASRGHNTDDSGCLKNFYK
jgi:hypothetical protein